MQGSNSSSEEKSNSLRGIVTESVSIINDLKSLKWLVLISFTKKSLTSVKNFLLPLISKDSSEVSK